MQTDNDLVLYMECFILVISEHFINRQKTSKKKKSAQGQKHHTMALIKVVKHPLLKGTIPYIFYLLIELLPPPIYLMYQGTKRRAESISKFHRRKEISVIDLLITVEFHLENLSAKRNSLKHHLPHKKKSPPSLKM